MSKDEQCNLSPGVDLVTAQFLTDDELSREYERLRSGSESLIGRVWRIPKFRKKVLELTRLVLFALIVWGGISVISRMGLWYDIYFSIVTAL